MMKIAGYFPIVFFSIFSWVGVDSPLCSETITIQQAIETAVRQNPLITAAKHKVSQSEAGITQAQSGWWPQVDISETVNRTTNPMWAFGTKLNQGAIETTDFDPERLNNPDPINNFNTSLSVVWPVFDGGKTYLGKKQAELNKSIAELSLQRTEQHVIAGTASAYVGVLMAMQNKNVVDQSLETAQANLNIVESRYKGGFAVKSDLLRAQVRISELEQDQLLTESRIRVARAMLGAMMGKDYEEDINLATPFESCAETKGTMREWIDKAMANRPDFKILKHQDEISVREIEKSKSGHLPQVNLLGAYEINTEDFGDVEDAYMIGAGIRVNLFSGKRISGQVTEAKAARQQINAMTRSTELSIRVEIREAYLQAENSWKRIEVARRATALADEGLRIVKNRYQSGLLTIVDLLDSEVADQQSRTLYFKALHDYKIARINLALAAGVIDQTFN